jgi:hypothetical protein
MGTMLLPALARADDSDGNDKQISVVVIATSPSASTSGSGSPSAGASPSASSSSTKNPGGGGSTGGGGDRPGSSATPSTAPGDVEVNVGGVLYISALQWAYHFSPNPFDGALGLGFTVRNEYSGAVDGTATFWLTNLFGGTVGIPVTVAVGQIKPHETRLVTATISGVSQWTFLTGHATFTPPARLGNTVLVPVTRTAPALVPPWAILLAAALIAGWYLFRRLARRRPAVGTSASVPATAIEPQSAEGGDEQ